ncbi:MAG: DinB family protein [Chitinophagaceae bacterium]|nr:DinB family protein [Chitinophagaceae bacterium]
MKELLKSLAAHHTWALQKITELMTTLPEEKLHQEITGSFGSLYHTLLHIWNAQSIWWQRLKLQEKITVPSEHFSGDIQELVRQVLRQSADWEEWITQASEPMLNHVFHYTHDKQTFKQEVWQMLIHLFQHTAYHRGQLVLMLRQIGVQKIPPTDYIVWIRLKK